MISYTHADFAHFKFSIGYAQLIRNLTKVNSFSGLGFKGWDKNDTNNQPPTTKNIPKTTNNEQQTTHEHYGRQHDQADVNFNYEGNL